MKTVKGLLLGSAAALVALTGAHAADLAPVQPVQYVKVCDAYGAGFFYIPGTQTCLRISGFAGAQFRYDEPNTRAANAISFRGRAGLNVDARSQTPWGTARAYVGVGAYFQNNNQQINQFFFGGANPAFNGANPLGAAPANGVYATNAYVQFAGLTAGYTLSNYSFPFGFPEVHAAPIADLLPTLQVAYTASFGNGVSATLAVEDGHYRRADWIGNAPGFGVTTTNPVLGGQRMPDIVANVRVIQGWGVAQLAGAVHQIRSNGSAGVAPIFSQDTNYGFAIQGGVSINLPMLGQGDKFALTAAYADGAMGYLGFGPTNSGSLFNALGGGYADAYVGTDGKLHNESGYQITATLKHYWTPTLRSNFTVAYDQDFAPSVANGAGPLSDLRYLTSAVNLIWSPIPDLDLGLEAFNQTAFLNRTQKAFKAANPAARGAFDGSKWTVITWIQRRF